MLTRWTTESEKEQLLGLQTAEILDMTARREFQRITQLTSQMFMVPIAIITVLDEHRQWFKAPVGVDMDGSLRTDAFCDHTIRNEGIMVIPDTHLDRRFSGNALVTGQPNIRFYAGVPLIMKSGHAIGSLCIIDTRPRTFSEEQGRQLAAMAAIVQAQIQYHHSIGKVDEVTGLHNRSQLQSDLNSLCIVAPQEARSLVLMEAINHCSLLEMSNALGLNYVEQLLRDIAKAVTDMTGPHATVYHVGLARFAWIISAGRQEDEEALVRQLLKHLQKPITSADPGSNFSPGQAWCGSTWPRPRSMMSFARPWCPCSRLATTIGHFTAMRRTRTAASEDPIGYCGTLGMRWTRGSCGWCTSPNSTTAVSAARGWRRSSAGSTRKWGKSRPANSSPWWKPPR